MFSREICFVSDWDCDGARGIKDTGDLQRQEAPLKHQ